ncbi:MAG: RNA polymerase sigma factor SigJ [Pseudomonadota bacterium]
MSEDDKLLVFEEACPQLLGVAFRLLGSMAEAEDAVQDTAARWFAQDVSGIDQPIAWLTRVCTNRCLDILRSARVSRTDYVGPWLPDQIQVVEGPSADEQLEISSSLTTAFLLVLERLKPKERAAYLLHDIFGLPFDEVANTLGMSEANCRKLASRARKLVRHENARFLPDPARQEKLLAVFVSAVRTGDLDALTAALADDVELRVDSGGKAVAIRQVLSGPADVGHFFATTLHRAWSEARLEAMATANGPGLVVTAQGKAHAVVSFGFRPDGRIAGIFILRNPDKISRFLQRRVEVQPGGGVALH